MSFVLSFGAVCSLPMWNTWYIVLFNFPLVKSVLQGLFCVWIVCTLINVASVLSSDVSSFPNYPAFQHLQLILLSTVLLYTKKHPTLGP